MDKEHIISRTQDVLKPFETHNVITFIHDLNAKTLTDNPKVTLLLIVVFAYALWRWSRVVLLFLFTLLSLSLLVKYTLPPSSSELSVTSTLPFVLGCMGVASVLLYFIFIRAD